MEDHIQPVGQNWLIRVLTQFVFWDRVSSNPEWPWADPVAQVRLEFEIFFLQSSKCGDLLIFLL